MGTKSTMEQVGTQETEAPVRKRSLKWTLIFDLIVLVTYAVAANPTWTGIGVHEWLSLGVLVVLFVHLAINAEWVFSALRRIFSNPSLSRTGNLVLDILILITLIVCAISGIMVSGAVLPALGLVAPGYFFWDPLHAAPAKALLAVLLVHLVLHVKWVASAVGRKERERDDGR